MSEDQNRLTKEQMTRLQELMDEADFAASPRAPHGPFDITVTFKDPGHYLEMVSLIQASQHRYSIDIPEWPEHEAFAGYTLRAAEPST